MRLIDADELEKVMTEDWFLEILAAQDTRSAIKKDIVNMIDSVPLAYDVNTIEYYKLGNCTNDCEHFDNAVTYGYNKAIDDFFDELQNYEDNDDWLRLKMSSIYEIAEQLKEGGVE